MRNLINYIILLLKISLQTVLRIQENPIFIYDMSIGKTLTIVKLINDRNPNTMMYFAATSELFS